MRTARSACEDREVSRKAMTPVEACDLMFETPQDVELDRRAGHR
uniref:Uncharacterized protein n=1 Tax=Lentzea sp. NRRL S-836 TaxID=1415540 RepID=U5YS45_9PSEU|nr:hypothetical protein [Lentzea sp. NRRL S-836]